MRSVMMPKVCRANPFKDLLFRHLSSSPDMARLFSESPRSASREVEDAGKTKSSGGTGGSVTVIVTLS